MKTIWTHPDNAEILGQRFFKEDIESRGTPSPFLPFRFDWHIKTNPHLERQRHSGKYILGDGRVVAKEDVRLVSRFVSYGPEDIHFLLYAGLIHEHMELLFHVMDDVGMFRMTCDWLPLKFSPNAFLLTS